MSAVYYKGNRLEKHRIQSVIDEWLSMQAGSGAHHSGEVIDGVGDALLVTVTGPDSDASAALAEYLREHGWNAKPQRKDST